ncbi:ATP-binding protein [Streptomyces gamaensis]|uniref:histidine kinase n=1 Tax=Streptomyces gamaensis TaxID=1763542 RepID=A0ABW0Z1L9_9ACTN
MRRPRIRRPRSLAGQLFAMQIVLVTAVVAGCAAFAYAADRGEAEESARHRVTAAAAAVAASPDVREAVRSSDPAAVLRPYAEQVRRDSGVDFVTVMSPRGIRWTHPDPARVGEPFLGHTGPALAGRMFSETYTGTLGPSVRAVAPVQDRGEVTALVSVGITVEAISAEERRQLLWLLTVALGALALGGAGTYLLTTRLRRHTRGMNAAELARMRDYHEAALHAVREGLLLLDGQRRVALVNDAGRELLGLRGEPTGRHVTELGLPPALTRALLAPEPCVDEVLPTAERIVVLNTSPVSGGERCGTVVTLRDHTELQELSSELDSVRGFAEALRSQAHEAANRLHAVVSLIELGRADEAVDFATSELELAQALTDRVVAAVAEPVLAALLLGKAAQAHEHGVELLLTPETRVDDGLLPQELPPRDLVTILGNLVDNAMSAAEEACRRAEPAAGGPDGSGGLGVSGEADGSGGPDRRAGSAPCAFAQDCAGTDGPAALGVVPPEDAARSGAFTAGGTTEAYGADEHDGAGGADGGPGPDGPRCALSSTCDQTQGGPLPAARPARVTVTLRPDGGELLIRVADTGAGVPEEAVEDVFRRGWSTKEPGASPHGRGIGLALVRQAARRNGGTVTVAGSPEGGAEFTVRLPLAAQCAGGAAAAGTGVRP